MKRKEIFIDGKKEIETLRNENFKEPQDLKEKIQQLYECYYQGQSNYTRCISFLEMWNGKFVERVFAYKLDRRKKGLNQIMVKEIQRRIEGNGLKLVKDSYYVGMAGNQVLWQPKRFRYYGIVELDKDFLIESESRYNFRSFDYFCPLQENFDNIKQANTDYTLQLDNSIKYSAFEIGGIGFIEHVSWFRKFPDIEMYAKLGIMHLLTDDRFYKKTNKNKTFRKYVQQNIEMVKRSNYTTILAIFKWGSEKRWKIEIAFKKALLDETLKENAETVKKYLMKQKENTQYYLDYYELAKAFNQDMSEPKLLTPNDLEKWHDHYVVITQAKKNKDLEESFLRVSSAWNKLNYSNNGFVINIATAQEEIIKEGLKLNHCVGKNGYIEKMCKNETLIFFVRKASEIQNPFFTVEFAPKENKALQIRGDNNKAPEKEVKDFVNEWEKIVPKLKKLKGEKQVKQKLLLA